MKGKTGQASTLLHPLLDSYLDSAVGIVGCSAGGYDRYSCEFDVVVVAEERMPPASFKFGDVYIDATFVTNEEVLKPAIPEHVLALAGAKPVRDTSLVLSTASATSSAMLSESAAKAATARLGGALKTLGRAEAALEKGEVIDADFWLLASTYEFARALLLTGETLPSPSHILSQLKENSAPVQGFEAISTGAGLEAAGRAGCGARLEGTGVLHDLLREGAKSVATESEWSKVRSEIMAAKASELVTRAELAESYSFLGQEVVDAITALQGLHPNRSLTSLTTGEDRLLGERLVRQLGLVREKEALKKGVETLKKQVAALAKA